MRFHAKLIIAALTASLILASAVSTATARNLSVNERLFDIIWRELSFQSETGSVNVRCPVTLLGSFHERTIRKDLGLLIGVIRHSQVGIPAQCTGGSATVLRESLPWHIRYVSFRGLLPRINSIRLALISASFRIQVLGVNCLARTTNERPALGDVNAEPLTGQITGLTPDPATLIPITGAFCPANGRFSNIGRVTRLDGGLLFVRLI